jgi:hypothetical protein
MTDINNFKVLNEQVIRVQKQPQLKEENKNRL